MTVLKVEGMHCNGCAERIKKALKNIGLSCKVSLEGKTVSVDASENKLSMVISEIEDLGFEVINN